MIHQKLSSNELVVLEEKIIRLRLAGESNRAIAERLGLRYSWVSGLCANLVLEGRLPEQRGRLPLNRARRQRFRNRASTAAHVALAKKVLRLIRDGQSNQQITDCTGLSYAKVSRITSRLCQRGLVPRDFGRPFIRSKQQQEFVESRRATITRLTREGATLKEIGQELGVSREWVRQLRDSLEADIGSIRRDWLTLSQAAALLGTTTSQLNDLMRHGLIRPKRRQKEAPFLLDRRDLRIISRLIERDRRRRCVVCGLEFDRKKYQLRFCSSKCRKQREKLRLQHMRPAAQGGKLLGWVRRAWELLRDRPLAEHEEWVQLQEACRRSGLSYTQVDWLRLRGILRSHRRKVYHARRFLYAASELDLVGQVWRDECTRRQHAQ